MHVRFGVGLILTLEIFFVEKETTVLLSCYVQEQIIKLGIKERCSIQDLINAYVDLRANDEIESQCILSGKKAWFSSRFREFGKCMGKKTGKIGIFRGRLTGNPGKFPEQTYACLACSIAFESSCRLLNWSVVSRSGIARKSSWIIRCVRSRNLLPWSNTQRTTQFKSSSDFRRCFETVIIHTKKSTLF